MSEGVYFTTMGIVFGTVLLIFAMRYLAQFQQARSRQVAEDAYRSTAEKAATAQTQNTALLSAIQADLADVRTRMAAIEKVLKAVE